LKILVTGGNGEFCKHLVEQGKEHSFLTPLKVAYDSIYPAVDVRNYWSVDWYFRQKQNEFDCVIHAGAITRPMVIHEDNPRLSIKTNIIGTFGPNFSTNFPSKVIFAICLISQFIS